jgi:hypothetical protein
MVWRVEALSEVEVLHGVVPNEHKDAVSCLARLILRVYKAPLFLHW